MREDLENLLNKAKPYYREIRPMRGRLMRGPPAYDFFFGLTCDDEFVFF